MFISLDSMLVPCVVCVSVLFTDLHEHAYTVFLLLCCECVLFTNKVWEFNLLQGLHFIALPSFMYVSRYKHEYSHCYLLWCEKGIVYVIRILVSYH